MPIVTSLDKSTLSIKVNSQEMECHLGEKYFISLNAVKMLQRTVRYLRGLTSLHISSTYYSFLQ